MTSITSKENELRPNEVMITTMIPSGWERSLAEIVLKEFRRMAGEDESVIMIHIDLTVKVHQRMTT